MPKGQENKMSQLIEKADKLRRLAREDIQVGIGLQDVLMSVEAEIGPMDRSTRSAAMHKVVDEFLKEFA